MHTLHENTSDIELEAASLFVCKALGKKEFAMSAT